jgi:hypothetical protein
MNSTQAPLSLGRCTTDTLHTVVMFYRRGKNLLTSFALIRKERCKAVSTSLQKIHEKAIERNQ